MDMVPRRGARMNVYDCVIIGGGPAGLTAATYLGRFNRRIALIDAGESRLQRIPLSRNVPGFPDGVSGPDLLHRMWRQAERYGVESISGQVKGVTPSARGFTVSGPSGAIEARTILLATGVDVVDPAIDGLEDAIARGVIRYCPVCDGYETRGQSVAVLGGRPGSTEEARFLTTYTDRVTYIPAHADFLLKPADEQRARRDGIAVAPGPMRRALASANKIEVTFENDQTAAFDTLYPCLGSQPRSDLLLAIGGKASRNGGVLTDEHQRTSVEGFYAAGDVLKGLDQIASACGQAAIAASAIHNSLRQSAS